MLHSLLTLFYRYFIIPSQLRLWPSFLLYNALSQPSSSNHMLVNTRYKSTPLTSDSQIRSA